MDQEKEEGGGGKEDHWVEEKGKQGANRGGEVSCLELHAKHPREPRETDMNKTFSCTPCPQLQSNVSAGMQRASSSHLRAESMTLLPRFIGRSTQNLPASAGM